MDRQVLHIEWNPESGAYWIHRVLAAVQSSPSKAVQHRRLNWDRHPQQGLTLGDLAVAVGTKMTLVSLAVDRVDQRLQEIGSILNPDRESVESCLRENAAYPLRDGQLAVEAILDFECFVFETRSAFEITVTFVERFFEVILGKPLGSSTKEKQHAIQEAVRNRGGGTDWIDPGRRLRNLLIHARSAWLAFEIVNWEPFRLDPVLLTKSVNRLDEDPERVSIEQCRDLWRGFTASYDPLEAWLKDEVREIEHADG